jgi:hemerythrin-like metal-binding protein
MAYFEWKDQYSVHIVQFDTQHQKLVRLLNELFDAMQAGKGKDVLEYILANLVDYTEVHFAAEEHLMRTNAYPGFLKHYEDHARFTEKIKAFQRQFRSGKVTLSVQLSSFLKEWLRDHILQTDQQYVEFFAARGIN